MLNALNVAKRLDPRVIDGKIYIDLDALADTLFKACEVSAQLAKDVGDPSLGIMTLGQTHTVQALDDILGYLQAQHGLEVTGTPQPR